MANLARLTVSIVGNTVSLNKSLNKAESRTKKFQRQASKSLSVLKGGLIALGVGIAAFSVKAIQDYASVGDEIDKMSKRTGFSAESLSKLRFAAEQSGAELATVEKGAKRMASVLLDAEDGLAETTRALDHLNLNVTDFTGLNPEQQFFKFADALAKVEDDSKRAALAQDIFGRAGTELLPLFREGEEGLAALAAQAEKLGIVYSQEAAEDAAAFKDAQNALGKALQGFLAKGIAPLLPKLTELINKVVENEELLRAMGSAALYVAQGIIDFIEEVEAAVKGIQDFIDLIKDFVKEVDKALDKIPNIFSDSFENAYLGSIPWIAKGKLLRHIQTLPFSVKEALQPIPDIFGTAFSQAFIIVAEDFDNLETRIIRGTKRIAEVTVEAWTKVKTATDLATEAFIANNQQYEAIAMASAHAAKNIYLAAQATDAQTKASAALFKQYEKESRAILKASGRSNTPSTGAGFSSFSDSTDPANFTLPPPGTGIDQPVIPGRRTGSELEDIKRIFEEQTALLQVATQGGNVNAAAQAINVSIDGQTVASAVAPYLNQQILDDREYVSEEHI